MIRVFFVQFLLFYLFTFSLTEFKINNCRIMCEIVLSFSSYFMLFANYFSSHQSLFLIVKIFLSAVLIDSLIESVQDLNFMLEIQTLTADQKYIFFSNLLSAEPTKVAKFNPPIYLHWDFRKFWYSPVWNIQFDELDFFPSLKTNWIFLPNWVFFSSFWS